MAFMQAPATVSRQLAHIDSLRGVAILMVVLVNAAQTYGLVGSAFDALARYGQMGVQLFFVLSAYTLCLSADQRHGESRPLLKYGLRRFFRIAPMYYLGVGLYAAVAVGAWSTAIPHAPSAEGYTPVNVVANVLFVHGFYAPANQAIVPGGWSIGTEVAFYLAFPYLFAFAKTCFAESGAGRVVWVMLAVCFSQIVLLCLYPLGLEVHNGGFVYFNLVTQAPVFFVGMAYYFHEAARERAYAVGYDVLAFAGLTAVALGLWSLYIGHLYSVIALVSAVSFVHLIQVFWKVAWLNAAWLQRLGRVSYSVYLLHFVVVWRLAGWLAGDLGRVIGGVPTILALFAASSVISYGLAEFTTRVVEEPFGRLGKHLIQRIDRRDAEELAQEGLTVRPIRLAPAGGPQRNTPQ